jgi:Fe-S cluster assembly scaffold protein SufB
MGERRPPQDRFPRSLLLLRAEEHRRPEEFAEVDPELLRTYERLGIPLSEQKVLAGVDGARVEGRVAVDAVFDSVSVVTTFKEELAKAGVIFSSISEALKSTPSWCANISAPWCRSPITTTPP